MIKAEGVRWLEQLFNIRTHAPQQKPKFYKA